ncbi:hypothetical protein MALH04_00292 [Mycoplasma anatis]|uniref:hypothetical protein n=1 Tax=Mycoplasmopsis anatis TaxID=171279 RepID=UPI001C4E0E34|nr:hypothetical protein [Mycoplasmopsis anatis]MBW0594539.1 hypothetical protein [Mycoplasmopsis anatis]MBW0598381.1 hypothetical protein [Mycoplasmopsis anatis]MBW0598982.1 hypothetical protein [Mycoplasmopsis anatis]MBW0601143.1 hypothetical protein [Mycoplasmopsis anatis]
MNKKRKIILNTTLGVSFVGAAGILGISAGLHTKTKNDDSVKVLIKDLQSVIKNNTESFKFLNNKDIQNKLYQTAEILDSNTSVDKKLESINSSREEILNNLINNFPSSVKPSENQYLQDLLKNQASFITESDLRNQFINENSDLINQIIKSANNRENAEKTKELLNRYKQNLDEQLKKQDELFKPYIDYINSILGAAEERLDDAKIDQIYKDYENIILSKDLNVNSLETLKNQIEEYKKEQAKKSEIEKRKEELQQLLQQNKDIQNNPDPELIKNIEQNLNNTTSDVELDLYEQLLKNNLVHNSDLSKPLDELKNSLKELLASNPLTTLKGQFDQINCLTPEMIDSITDVKELVKLKDKYLDDLAYFKYAEKKQAEVQEYLNNSHPNIDIKKMDYDKLKADADLNNLFNDVTSAEELKQKIDFLDKEYNEIKNKNIIANAQLDQLLEDLEFFDKYSDTKNTVKIANDLIRDKINNAQNSENIDSTDMDVYTRKLQEEVRQNAKEQLKYLQEKADRIAKQLEGLNDPVTQAIIEQIKNLNAVSKKMSDSYSPSSTKELKEQILKYDFLANIEELSRLNYEIMTKNDDLLELADSIFPESLRNDELYVNTKDEVSKINDFVFGIKNDLSVLNNPEKFSELINSLKEKKAEQQIVEKNLKEKNKLDNLLKDFDRRNEFVELNPEIKDRVGEQIKTLNDEITQLKKQLDNPALDNKTVKDIIAQIEAKINEQKEIVDLAYVQNELDKTLDKINEFYPDDNNSANDSRGEGGLRKNFEQIKEKILNPNLSESERNKLVAELAEVKDTASRIKQLEDSRDELEKAIDQAKSTEHDRITDSKLASATSALKNLDATIESMLSDNTPTLAELEKDSKTGNEQTELLKLALEQDKIVINNNKLQEKNLNIDDPDYLAIKKSFDKINRFTNSEASKNDLEQINQTAKKIASMIPLADELNNLYEFIQTVKDDPKYDALEKQARDLLQRSLFNQDKTSAQINDNVNEIKEALKIYESKKKLNEEINKLEEVFNDADENDKESDKAIFADLKKKLESLKYQNNSLFESPYETESSINQAISELIKDREKLIEDKQKVQEEFNLEVEKTESKVSDYDTNKIPADKDGHPTYEYSKYDEIKAQFEARKDQKDVTFDEVKQLNQDLDKAFKYDQANNAIKDLEAFVTNAANINALTNDPVLDKVKKNLDNLISNLKDKLIDPTNFNSAALDKIKEQALVALQLAKEQEDPVLLKINEFKNDPVKQKDYEALVVAVNKSLPNEPYESENLRQKYEKLVEDSNNILELSDLREKNERTIGSKVEPLSGLYKEAKDLLGNADVVDQKAYEEFVKELDKLNEQNKLAKDKVAVEQIQTKLNELKDRLTPLKNLASAVKQEQAAKEKINSSANHEITQDFLNKFIPTIDKNIADSQSMYMNNKVSSDLLNSKANTLNGIEGYSHVKELNNAIELANKVTVLMNRIKNESALNPEIEYHEYQQVNGNKQNYDNWTKWFNELLTVFYNDRTQENYDNLSLVLNRATQLFDKQKEVSEKITSRKTEVANYVEYQIDVDYLVKKLWDSTPITYSSKRDTEAWKEELTNRVNKLDEILQTEEFNHSTRIEIKNSIDLFKAEKIDKLTSDSDKLKSGLNERISKIQNKNIDSLNGESLKVGLTTDTFEEIKANLKVLTDIFDKASELSSRVKVARDIIINFSSTQDAKLRDQLEVLKAKCDLIDTKYTQYNSVEKTNGKVDIITDLNDLNKTLVKIEFVAERANAENLINSNLELTFEEKKAILDILDTAQRDFEHQLDISPVDQYSNVITEIKDKYFAAAVASPATEIVISQPTKIYQIFENSVLVKNKLFEATNIASYEVLLSSDPNKLIDSQETHDAYAELNKAINEATLALRNTFIDENNKKTKFALLNEKLELLNNAKKADIQKILDRAEDLKKYMETADQYGQTYTVKDIFTEKAITDINNAKGLFENGAISIAELNEYLTIADNEIKNQVLALFNSVKTWVTEELTNVQELQEKFQVANTRSGADLSDEIYQNLITTINNSKSVETTDTKNYREAVNYKEILENEYKDKYNKLNQVRNNFISKIKDGFNKYLNTNNNANTNKKGLFVVFDEALKGYINDDKKDNLLVNAKFDATIQIYKNAFATTLAQLTAEINTITAIELKDPTKLSEYGTKLTEFRTEFNNLINQMYNDGINYTSINFRGTIDEIIAEISINPNNSIFDAVKEEYKAEITKLNEVLTSVKTSIDANSVDIDNYVNNFIDIFTKIDGLYKWVNVEQNEIKLFEYITQNSRFSDIETKDESRRADFINTIMSFVLTDNSQTIDFIDITKSKTVLEYFNKFAFTDIDLDTILNKDNVKVRIVKQDDKSWYVKVPNNNLNKQILGIRLEYYYTPVNLRNFVNKDEIKLVKDVQISFNTNDVAQIQPGSSTIFVNTVNGVAKYGNDAKVELLDLDRAGLLDSNNTDEQIINQIYQAFKDNVLGANQQLIIKPSDRNNSNTEVANNIKNNVLNFDISSQTFFVIDKFISIKAQYKNQYTIVFADDTTKTINLISITPATANSAQRENDNKDNGDKWFNEQYGKILNDTPTTSILSETMPFAVVNLYKFKLSIEEVNKEKKAMINLDYFESSLFAKHFKLNDPKYANLSKITDRYVWSGIDFADYLSNNQDLIYNKSERILESSINYTTKRGKDWINNIKFRDKVAILNIDTRIDSGSIDKNFNYRNGFLYINNGEKFWVNRMQGAPIYNTGIVEFYFKIRK